ncbi:PQQ-dependent dehydrogenase, methanol/ethanol family [Devosia ginsengisoli]|uniref:PQQ-dependent dehydrogenase, methanol/ethanol family n=1 Tax=Devosia ginsengisoli TaxID=400770 RepID=UPI0026F35933|nr:PQQ-dependent dehydrogenase, methanol/ethanol family [Devosia ginsengisoli]MCR6670153.1 PQQ-dependent dehydrogenase, methanol/ethanol family [Devosia ginsengisoli]
MQAKHLGFVALASVLMLGAVYAQDSFGITDYPPVTDDQLINPAPGDWPMYRRTYDGQGYSPLDQINKDNVAQLVPAWSYSTGVVEGHESPPVVVNGVMFVTTPEHHVFALNAATGQLYWKYTADITENTNPSHPTNRGVAVLGDKVFYAAHDATLVALDAKTGEEVWSTEVANVDEAYYMTLAPLVADGKVLIGVSGGEYGIRGFVAAYDAETGEEAWKTYTIPAPDEPGGDTWPEGAYVTGAGSTWSTGNYDPESKLVYWGVGNAGPWMGDQRPGDNLYTASTIALDVETGEIKGHFQYNHNESFDWDEVTAPILVDLPNKDGETVKGLVNPTRSGILWALERTSEGPINFIWGEKYVPGDVVTAIDPETGRLSYDESKKPSTGTTKTYCPSVHGGRDWPSTAYSPDTGLLYIPANANMCTELTGAEVEYEAGQPFIGFDSLEFQVTDDAEYIGSVQAWDVATGEMKWEHKFPRSGNWGPILATGGGLIFSGGTNDRMFRAYDAENGDVLWEQKLNSGVIGTPSTFEVDGKQYVAVQAGYGVDAVFNNTVIAEHFGISSDVPQGGVVWVFEVKDGAVASAE